MGIYSLLFSLLVAGVAFGKNPSNWPQTTFSASVVRPTTAKVEGVDKGFNITSEVQKSKMFQIDLEVPYHDFLNIGFSMQFMGGKGDVSYPRSGDGLGVTEDVPHIYLGLGPFWRLQYAILPQVNSFARFDLGVGPFLFGGGGMTGMAGVQVGGDVFLGEWFAVTAGYSKNFFYGVETVASNRPEIAVSNQGKKLRFSMNADAIMVGLKSTYF